MQEEHLKSGAVRVRAYVGRDPETGRKRYVSETLPPKSSRKAIRTARARVASRAAARRGSADPSATVSAWFSAWIDSVEDLGGARTTAQAYRSYLRCHVAPAFGAIPMCDVTTEMVDALYRRLLSGESRAGKPLAPSTVSRIHAMLKKGFDRAVTVGTVQASPVTAVTRPPRRAAGEASSLDQAALGRLLVALDDPRTDDTTRAAALLSLATGMRRGEACALTWGDVTLGDAPRVAVRRSLSETRRGGLQPKSTKSGRRRDVAIDVDTAAMLTSRKAAQAAALVAEGRLQTAATPVLDDGHGRWVRPSWLSHSFARVARRAGISAHFHTLRHTAATMLLASGATMREVCDRLGHADVSTTMRLYVHSLPESDRRMADMSRGYIVAASGEVSPQRHHADASDGSEKRASTG